MSLSLMFLMVEDDNRSNEARVSVVVSLERSSNICGLRYVSIDITIADVAS